MSDGPFRNVALTSRWKVYGQKLISDATSAEERMVQACHSMVRDVDMKTFHPLFGELRAHAQRPQMDLDPAAAIETIFDRHPRSFLSESLNRHLIANLRDQISPEQALDQALGNTAREWIGTTKNRLDEHCIRARDLGDMKREDYRKGLERNHETFSAIKPDELCAALASGNKRAFGEALHKKSGVDEGPEE
ncbi:hypothetical protein [Paraburkholderia oxyphila]|uniref:hypothetical protein n=1 Tax=Paraburkholderia oxyphila TaxID=614212 RepID=UPI0004825443|nr:hypothetical protein [Paraburkholderia oxyphila]